MAAEPLRRLAPSADRSLASGLGEIRGKTELLGSVCLRFLRQKSIPSPNIPPCFSFASALLSFFLPFGLEFSPSSFLRFPLLCLFVLSLFLLPSLSVLSFFLSIFLSFFLPSFCSAFLCFLFGFLFWG